MSAIGGFDLVPCGAIVLDQALIVVDGNSAACTMLGRSREQLVGRPLVALMPRASVFFFQTHVLPVLEFAGSASELYLILDGPDGAPLHVLLNAARSDDGTTHLAFMPIYRRQLFERELVAARGAAELAASQERQAQEQLRAAQAQLAMSERLAAVGTLAAGIAHEINNPLAYVAGNLELAERSADPERMSASIASARHGVERIRRIVDSLRIMSRVRDEVVATVDLGQVVDVTLQVAAGAVRDRAVVQVEAPAVPVLVRGDEGRIGQIVLNLVVNAAQAAADGPPGRSGSAHHVLVRIAAADQHGIVDVIDDGPGVPDDLRARIFEPFFTTKPAGEGTGLGLALAHQLATAMGGTLTLEASRGAGAWFRLAVPLVTDAGSESPAPAATAGTRSSGGVRERGRGGRDPVDRGDVRGGPGAARRVLVVDDDVPVALLLAEMLAGHDVTVCHDGAEALALLHDGVEFDAVVCDLVMPRVGGMELYAELRHRWPSLAERVVFVSGGAVTDETARFLAGTPNPVLRKPCSVGELRAACERVAGDEMTGDEMAGDEMAGDGVPGVG